MARKFVAFSPLRLFILALQKILFHIIVTEGIMHLSAAIPGGVTPGNPRAFAPRHLQIPLTQGQYSSTKSYHCPPPPPPRGA